MNTHCVSGPSFSPDIVTAWMPAEPLIQCHGLCGTNFVRSCSSQTLMFTGSTLMSTLFYASIVCSAKLVSFSGRNVVVLAGMSTSMTFADVCCIRSLFNSLFMQQFLSCPLSHCCSDWPSLVVREQNASNHSRSYIHPAHKMPIELTPQLVSRALRGLLPPEAAHLVRLPPGTFGRYCHNMVGDAQSSTRFCNQPTSPRRSPYPLWNLADPIPIGRFEA